MVEKTIHFEDVKDITAEEYFTADEYAASMFNAKYAQILSIAADGTKIIETPAQVFWRVASQLALFENPSEQRHYAECWFGLLWLGWFRPGGSILAGVGKKAGQSLINCTTLPILEDSLEGIAKCDYEIMKTAAFRQGIGIDASILRPRRALVNNAAEESTGAIPWVSKLVDNGKYVGQRGRIPALLISLKVEHMDIEDFITAKTELGVIENANISVQISDAFMDAVFSDSDWTMTFDFDDDRESMSKTVNAKKLFELIASTACKSAEPGVQYIDQMRRGSIVHQIFASTGDERFKVISTNACSEKPMPAYGGCNLLSINVEMFSTDPAEYAKELAEIAPYLVRLADNVVSYELSFDLSPLPEQAAMLRDTREIGCGITNLHGWFLKQDIAYASEESIVAAEDFMKCYATSVFEASVLLGKEKGNAPGWDMVKDKSHFMGSTYFNNVVCEAYECDVSRIRHMRNMAHMSVAPAGSISGTFPILCLGSGGDPLIAAAYWRRTRAIDKGNYTHYFTIPKKVREYILRQLDVGSDDYVAMANFPGSEQDEDGKIGIKLMRIINRVLPKGFFTPAHFIDPEAKIRLMAGMYKWVDAAISTTYNLPEGTTAQTVSDIYMKAYQQGVRAVSVYVEGSREGVLIFDDPVTNAAKFAKTKSNVCVDDRRPTSIIINCAPKRPEALPCDIWQTSIKGEVWIVLVGMLDNMPFEIFCGSSDDIYLPQTCKEGIIRKSGKGKYQLEIIKRRNPLIFKDLANVLMSDDEKALTRVLSLSLRHGVPPQYVVDQLKKTNGNITAFSTAISRVLAKYVSNYTLKDGENKCPTCSENSLVFSAGCIECVTPGCGYTRCG